MKRVIHLFFVLALVIGIFISCNKEEEQQEYTDYSVEYLLQNNLNKAKRFTITYKNPAFANKVTESYEAVEDTLWVRFDAKSLDLLYFACQTRNDTADYSISIYVDAELITMDSTSCDWQCDTTFVEVNYPLP